MRDFQRKALRVRGHDYRSPRNYFVTITMEDRACVLGAMVGDVMRPTEAGLMVESWWCGIPRKFPTVAVDSYVVMPNHFHGVLILTNNSDRASVSESRGLQTTGGHGGPPLQPGRAQIETREQFSEEGMRLQAIGVRDEDGPSLGKVIQWFKSITTWDYARGVKEFDYPPFNGRLWQRNYYERIVRNDDELNRIRHYILNNPLNWPNDELHRDQ